nr:hypothetical protein KPHV_28690 [Kitasatospora purpeofusca]
MTSTARHTFTGPTDYRTSNGWFPGPHVTGAPILAVTPITFETTTRPAVRLLLANTSSRGPQHVVTAQWGTPADWQPHPQRNTEAITSEGTP